MSEHTKEPWENTGRQVRSPFGLICDCDRLTDVFEEEKAKNARRIVACVNACEGILTEELENAGAGFWGRFSAREGRRAEKAEARVKELEGALECAKVYVEGGEIVHGKDFGPGNLIREALKGQGVE